MYNVKQFCSRRKAVFVVLMLGLFFLLLKLGFWQLQRAQEKAFIIASKTTQQSFIPWLAKMPIPSPYTQVSIDGYFLKTIFYLDNQWYKHQLGYDVILPFQVNKKSVVMVDIGWINRPSSGKLPLLEIPNVNQIQGYAYFSYAKQLILGALITKKSGNRILIEKMDAKILGNIINKNVYPFIVRLDPHVPFGYIRDWNIVNITPERHKAYALQWFGLAVVVMIGLIAVFRK